MSLKNEYEKQTNQDLTGHNWLSSLSLTFFCFVSIVLSLKNEIYLLYDYPKKKEIKNDKLQIILSIDLVFSSVRINQK
jgi:hypothetical protein